MNGSSQPLTRTLKYLLPRSPLCTIAHYEALLYRCSTTKSLSTTKQVHAPILRIQLLHHCDSTHFLSLLTASYALCSQTSLARKVFDELSFRTLFSYKSMIKIYTQTGAPHNALKLFDEMLHSSQQMPDRYIFPFVICACGDLLLREIGVVVHGLTILTGVVLNAFLGNSLLVMYMKCGDKEGASRVFYAMQERTTVS